jgi:vacuolar iron transporter family protein
MRSSTAYKHLQHREKSDKRYQDALHSLIYKLQKSELFAATVYLILADRQQSNNNGQVLKQAGEFEMRHQETLEKLSGRKAIVSKIKVKLFLLLTRILGYTFALKMMEKKISFPMDNFIKTLLIQHDSRFVEWFHEEEELEQLLLQTLDEARLRYISSMVLGLNDALTEITATLAGFSLSMNNNRLVAISGFILGISATLSMTSSEYLSHRSENNPKAIQAALLCGTTYIFVSLSLILPFFLYPADAKIAAVITMLIVAFCIILIFNFYLSVTKDLPFLKRFGEMLIISSVITTIAFGVGFFADRYLNVGLH